MERLAAEQHSQGHDERQPRERSLAFERLANTKAEYNEGARDKFYEGDDDARKTLAT